jgi:hypothetical protein
MVEWKQWKNLKVVEWVNPPHAAHIINSKIVYKLKLDYYDTIKRWKAQIVVRGFQKSKSEVVDSFAPM